MSGLHLDRYCVTRPWVPDKELSVKRPLPCMHVSGSVFIELVYGTDFQSQQNASGTQLIFFETVHAHILGLKYQGCSHCEAGTFPCPNYFADCVNFYVHAGLQMQSTANEPEISNSSSLFSRSCRIKGSVGDWNRKTSRSNLGSLKGSLAEEAQATENPAT